MRILISFIFMFCIPSMLFAGQAYEWGNDADFNANGRVAAIASLTDAVQISGNSRWSVARRTDGSLLAWGTDSNLQVTNLPSGTFIDVWAGWTHGIAIKSDKSIVEWGQPYGNTHTIGVSPWVTPSTTSAKQVCAGDDHSAALLEDGTVLKWGGITSVPDITGLYTNVQQIACGWYTVMMLNADGTVTVVGKSHAGETITAPVGLTSVSKIRASYTGHYAIKSDGTVTAWGAYDTYSHFTMPVGATNIVDINGGKYHSIACRNDGTLFVWGIDDSSTYDLGQVTSAPTGVTCISVGGGAYHSQMIQGTTNKRTLFRP